MITLRLLLLASSVSVLFASRTPLLLRPGLPTNSYRSWTQERDAWPQDVQAALGVQTLQGGDAIRTSRGSNVACTTLFPIPKHSEDLKFATKYLLSCFATFLQYVLFSAHKAVVLSRSSQSYTDLENIEMFHRCILWGNQKPNLVFWVNLFVIICSFIEAFLTAWDLCSDRNILKSD